MTQRKHITCWMLSSHVKDRSWVRVRMKDPLHIILHFIAFCILLSTGFTVRKLYYVSILFYYASVFDFPKFKNFILLYVIAKECLLPWSIRNSLQNRTVMTQNWFQSQFSDVLIHLSAASARQRSATTNELEHWKMQEYVLIYQPEKNSFHLCWSSKCWNNWRKKEIKQWKESDWTLPLPNWNKWCVSFS